MSCRATAFHLLAVLCLLQTLTASPRTNYAAIIRAVAEVTQAEVDRGAISGVTIALVDDQQTVFVRGFGFADKKRRRPANADTVYRAGSISKLFTAMAAMQLVERGRLDIDKPVTAFLPDFYITNPFGEAMTLRQLMCHRSGMVRESPVGSYFDDTEPGVARTVASLSSCVLVHPPGTRTKYSNSGVTIVGHTIERVTGLPFEVYAQRHLLNPLGMTNSAFMRTPGIRRNLASGYLPVAQLDGTFRETTAPVFELGTLPAGNLYTTAEDLARFLQAFFRGGGSVVRADTLAEMFTPQLTSDTNGFGLGFNVGHFRGRKTVSHTGAVYGFTSSLAAMPAEKLGVIVLCNDDLAVGPVRKLSDFALGLILGEAPDASGESRGEGTSIDLAAFTGDYESQSFWGRIEIQNGKLMLNCSGQQLALEPSGPLRFEANGRIAHRWAVTFERDTNGHITTFTAPGQKFQRVDPAKVPLPPPAWKALVGSYGPGFIPLIVSIKHGHLYAMTENEFDYRLTPVNQWVYKMPPGLYTDEQLVFQPDRQGRVHTAVLANMPLRRR
ncbi:MAG: beta-lactamase family protein [Verrucomicrobia subdivision 3 bacterium]|nr:beta-lactamase family protein [Limisphaerales bacterium]